MLSTCLFPRHNNNNNNNNDHHHHHHHYYYLQITADDGEGIEPHFQQTVVEPPRFAGWWGHRLDDRFAMAPQFIPCDGVYGYRLSNPPVLLMAGARASLDLFDRVGNFIDFSYQSMYGSLLIVALKRIAPSNRIVFQFKLSHSLCRHSKRTLLDFSSPPTIFVV